MAGIPDQFTEVVQGQIIGEITWRYEFWKDGRIVTQDGITARSHFNNDTDAIDWFKAHFAQRNVEMRVFGQ